MTKYDDDDGDYITKNDLKSPPNAKTPVDDQRQHEYCYHGQDASNYDSRYNI